MLKLHGDARFIFEHRDKLIVLGDMRQDSFDRNRALKSIHAKLDRFKHLGHAAETDAFEQEVGSKFCRLRQQRPLSSVCLATGKTASQGLCPLEAAKVNEVKDQGCGQCAELASWRPFGTPAIRFSALDVGIVRAASLPPIEISAGSCAKGEIPSIGE
jgi:hypothetical protein